MVLEGTDRDRPSVEVCPRECKILVCRLFLAVYVRPSGLLAALHMQVDEFRRHVIHIFTQVFQLLAITDVLM